MAFEDINMDSNHLNIALKSVNVGVDFAIF